MHRFDGRRVSRRWYRVLWAARKSGVKFTLTSGRRTLTEQWVLYRRNMLRPGVPRAGHPLTALPSPNAPHIWVGRQNHAIDVNALDGGEARLQAWLERQGTRPRNPVRGEAWHLTLGWRQLRRLARRYGGR